jgi:hypothetical protein
MKYAVIQWTGLIEIYEVDKINYEDIKKELAGGYLEAIFLDHAVMYLDEDGKSKGLTYNPYASGLVRDRIKPDDYIAGTVVLVGPPDDEGEETGLDQFWLTALTKMKGGTS